MCVCMCDSIYANVSDNMFFLEFCSTSVCCSALSKMLRPMDRSGKRKATSPLTLPPPSWMLVHCGNTGKRRSKVTSSKTHECNQFMQFFSQRQTNFVFVMSSDMLFFVSCALST